MGDDRDFDAGVSDGLIQPRIKRAGFDTLAFKMERNTVSELDIGAVFAAVILNAARRSNTERS